MKPIVRDEQIILGTGTEFPRTEGSYVPIRYRLLAFLVPVRYRFLPLYTGTVNGIFSIGCHGALTRDEQMVLCSSSEFPELKDFQTQTGTDFWRFLYEAGTDFYLHIPIMNRTVPVFSIPVLIDTKLIQPRK